MTTRQQQLQLQLARATMKTKSTRQRGEQRDSEGATRYAPKKNTFIHVLTTTPETNRTTTRDEEGHTPSSSYLPFRHGEGGMPSVVPSRHDKEGMPLLAVLLPSRYDREAYAPPRCVVFAIPIRQEECTPSRHIVVAISTRRGGASHSNAGRGLPPHPCPTFPLLAPLRFGAGIPPLSPTFDTRRDLPSPSFQRSVEGSPSTLHCCFFYNERTRLLSRVTFHYYHSTALKTECACSFSMAVGSFL